MKISLILDSSETPAKFINLVRHVLRFGCGPRLRFFSFLVDTLDFGTDENFSVIEYSPALTVGIHRSAFFVGWHKTQLLVVGANPH